MTQHTPTRQLTEEQRPEVALVLRVISGPDFGASLKLVRGTYVVGKAPECDLVLSDGAISRSHLLVQVLPGGARLKDNQSTNGSFYRDSRFTSLEAGPGTEIRLGKTVLRLEPEQSARASVPPSEATSFGPMVGRSVAMRQVFAVLERIAPREVDVLLVGETGTGKEICARALHAQSPRHAAPFVVIDVPSLSSELMEAELFGHRRGAFTGATTDRVGPFERAEGGTVYLDEVGEVPLEVQSRLLRVLERREVRAVGADEWRRVDVRVIASTHRDLEVEVAEGRFRKDLYHRLAVAPVVLPPLRDRPDDLPLLVDTLARRGGWDPGAITPQTRALLAGYAWPGNVRELENLVARVASLGLAPFVEPAKPGPAELPFKDAKERLIVQFERDYLERLMQRCDDNLSRAAREAGVERLHLRKLLRKHGLRGDDDR